MSDSQQVVPLFEREPDSVPGPFYVIKDMCIICALPPDTAAKNIAWDEAYQQNGCIGCPSHCRIACQPERLEEIEQIIQAAVYSCIQAIRYCGIDPQIIA